MMYKSYKFSCFTVGVGLLLSSSVCAARHPQFVQQNSACEHRIGSVALPDDDIIREVSPRRDLRIEADRFTAKVQIFSQKSKSKVCDFAVPLHIGYIQRVFFSDDEKFLLIEEEIGRDMHGFFLYKRGRFGVYSLAKIRKSLSKVQFSDAQRTANGFEIESGRRDRFVRWTHDSRYFILETDNEQIMSGRTEAKR